METNSGSHRPLVLWIYANENEPEEGIVLTCQQRLENVQQLRMFAAEQGDVKSLKLISVYVFLYVFQPLINLCSFPHVVAISLLSGQLATVPWVFSQGKCHCI